MAAKGLGNPHLPMEIILRILTFALTSQHPIIDPLSPCTVRNITKQEEQGRKAQLAIGILSTCKALREEGSQVLWTSNTFTFTSPQAVRNFAALDARYRSQISHVNFRVIAQYYDDDKSRTHRLSKSYHRDLKRDLKLKVEYRPKEGPLIRPGFRSYSWSQIVDFFAALRPPYDPGVANITTPRPRLLPALTSLRLDLVNFADGLLPFSGSEFHDIASHEFGCTLNELQVTGMPFDDAGIKATCELCGLLKDEGLYLDCIPTAVLGCKGRLSSLSTATWCGRVVRAQKANDSDNDDDDDDGDDYAAHHPKLGLLPPAPAEEGHPETPPDMVNSIIWKKVPVARDDSTREWLPFRRQSGYEAKGIVPAKIGGTVPRNKYSVLSYMSYFDRR